MRSLCTATKMQHGQKQNKYNYFKKNVKKETPSPGTKDKSEEAPSLLSCAVRNARENLPSFSSSFPPASCSQFTHVTSEALKTISLSKCILVKWFSPFSRGELGFPQFWGHQGSLFASVRDGGGGRRSQPLTEGQLCVLGAAPRCPKG